MAHSPRRRKAVDGLAKLPTTEQEWRGMALKYGLANAKLQDLCSYGRFSGSTVPKEAFLTMRCFWPNGRAVANALPHILETRSFFNEHHVADAKKLFDRRLLGLDQLSNLFEIICVQSEAKTPRDWPCTVADGLGPFSMLISLRKQIMGTAAHAGPGNPLTFAPKKQGYYDASQPSSGLIDISPTPRRPKRQRLRSPEAMDEDDPHDTNTTSQPFSRPEVELLQQIMDALPDEIPDPRTPTETLVADFMVNFIGGIACLVQRLANYTVCVANAFETTYRFGPVRMDPPPPPAENIQFRARIDGSIPFSMPADPNLPEMVIFEAKRAPREPGKGVHVMGQQSMEHAAYIAKRHENTQTSVIPGVCYHTFMIAQDYLSFYITIGSYDSEYLGYIFGPADGSVIPPSSGTKAFLRIREFGPFRVDNREHMELLLRIILSLLVWQLDGKEEGHMIREVLR
ncbi:hypothetical protein FQN50_009487 [Emmonsiellopsis sp. PD_5]|nr:hypothetical protein FQN50_009487 [Emmonsiellopsis sp. PD_5]